jgi:hypothetical protein
VRLKSTDYTLLGRKYERDKNEIRSKRRKEPTGDLQGNIRYCLKFIFHNR